MIIEWLRFRVKEGLREKFLQIDQEIWTVFLASQPGFIKKEAWINPDSLEEVILTIYWQTRESWKSIPATKIRELEDRFSHVIGKENYQLLELKEYQVRKIVFS